MGSITPRVPRRRHAARRISACLTLAAMAGMTCRASGAGYTWTGAGGDSLWSDTNNWNPTSGFPGTTGTDTATFSGTVTGNLPNLNGSYTLGELIFSTVTGGWTINNTSASTLTLNGVGGIGINAISQTSGTTAINANLALSADQTWEVGKGGTLVFDGTILGGVGGSTDQTPTLTLTGGGTFNILSDSVDGISTPGLGNVVVSSGTLDVSGAGILNTGALTLNAGGTAIADDTTQAVGYRFAAPPGAGVPFATSLNGGTFILRGNTGAGVNESLGDVTVGAGMSTITISSSGGSPTLQLYSLSRTVGSGVLFVNGTGLGTAGSPDGVIFNGQITVNTAPAGQVGGAQAGTTDNPAMQNAAILPYVLGEVPVASGAIGSQTGVPDTFVAYTNGSTLRPLNPVDEYSHVVNSTVNGNNIYINSATTASTATINSLVINNADLSIGDGQTVTDLGGALLFVTSNSIKPANASGTLVFGNGTDNIIAVDSGVTGTINAALAGSAPITFAGPGQLNLTSGGSTYSGTITQVGGALQFGPGGSIPVAANVIVNAGTAYVTDGANAGYAGTMTANNSSIIQFGNGTAGNDGALGGGTVNMGDSNNAGVAIDNVGPTTFGAAINTPPSGVNGNIYVVGPGAVTFNGNIDMESGPGAPFMWLHGGAGGGAITINGNITQNPKVTQAPGSTYFYVATNGGVTFNGNIAGLTTDFYMEGIPLSAIYGGITTPTVGGQIPNIVVTLGSSGSVGNGFAGNNPNTPNASSPSEALTVTNMNRSGGNLGTLPPPVVFNQNGPINASGGNATTWAGYYSGVTVWNVNAPLAVGTSLGIDFDSHGDGTAAPFGIMNVAPGQTVTVAPLSTNTQTGFLLMGYGNYTADVQAGSYGYMRVGAGASINNDGNKATTYIGYQANGMLDLTNLNNDGSSGPGSTLNTYYQVTINGGGFAAGQASVANLYPGSTLNMYSVTSTPNITNNTGNAEYPSGTTAAGASNYLAMNANGTAGLGDTAILNVMGGTLNNANSVNGSGGSNFNVGINMYGSTGNDNHVITALPTAVLNISNGGVVRTGFIRAETISFNGITSDAANFINFGGYIRGGVRPLPGELDYNQANSSQGTFIQYGVAGTYIYSGGAIIGTSIDNANFTTNSATIVQGLMAAPGKGVSNITLPGGPIGSGYSGAPIVLIQDGQGFDATAYAVVGTNPNDPTTYGKITGIQVTNPGFNFDGNATLKFIGGGGTAPASGYSINLTPTTSSGFQDSGGLTKVGAGTLTLLGTYNKNNSTGSPTVNSITSAGTAAAIGFGNIPAAGAGNAGAGFRNNTSTYIGPTVIEAGTLALSNSSTNNNLPYSSMIVVGDVPGNGGSVFDVSGTTTAGGFHLGPNQILAGFGTVKGTAGVTIGAASGGSNFGGGNGSNGLPAIASNGAGSMLAPGISPFIGTAQGNAAGSSTPVTGKLTLTSGGATPLTTTFGANGGYFWKLNLGTAGGATAGTPAVFGTPATATGAGTDVSGANWDAVLMDTVAVTSFSGSPFTINAFGFTNGSSNIVRIGPANTQAYAWVIARVNDSSFSNIGPASLAAQFALNTSNLPAPAGGWGYMLSTQPDPTAGMSDLVVSYVPTPEPSALMLLAPAAAAMFLRRRRRKAGRAEAAA